MRDTETGSTWTFEGSATAGEMEGPQLELLVADSPFWFARSGLPGRHPGLGAVEVGEG